MLERHKFFVGVNTGYVTGGEPDERFVDFYARRSSAALYCAIIGNVVIPGGYCSNRSTPIISQAQVWTLIAEAISKRGSIPGIQLATAWDGYQGARTFLAKDTGKFIGEARKLVRDIGKSKISELFNSLYDGTSMALDAGFRHVQLHAAHGYLFSLLVDNRIYDGADDILEQVAEWSTYLRSSDIWTSIRISLRTGDPNFDAVHKKRFQDQIAALPVDFVDASSGFYNINKQLIYPALQNTLQMRREETLDFAYRHPNVQLIFSGRALLQTENTLPANVHIGICRDLIANPDFLIDRSNGCVNSGKCHYYSRGANHISCTQWNRKED